MSPGLISRAKSFQQSLPIEFALNQPFGDAQQHLRVVSEATHFPLAGDQPVRRLSIHLNDFVSDAQSGLLRGSAWLNCRNLQWRRT